MKPSCFRCVHRRRYRPKSNRVICGRRTDLRHAALRFTDVVVGYTEARYCADYTEGDSDYEDDDE